MSCLICANPLARTICAGVWQQFHCPECGKGRICQELISRMMLLNLQLDVRRSRKWLELRKSSDPLPMMRVCDILLCRGANDASGPATGAEG